MIGERTLDGWELRLRPVGPGRFVGAAFLVVWLLGWAVGEALAIWILARGAIALVTGEPPAPGHASLEGGVASLAGAFLLVWLSLWTLGGIAAIAELLRSLFGEDRLLVSGGRLTVTRARGPFRAQQVFERAAIHRIVTLAPHDFLALEAGTRRVELSRLGTRAERAQAVPVLLRELAIPESCLEPGRALPDGWEEVATPEGERALVPALSTRRIQARITTFLALASAAVACLVLREGVGVAAWVWLLITVVLGVAAVRLAHGRREWRIDAGRLTLRKRFGASARDQFEARRLALEMTSDSDGDLWYALYGLGEGAEVAAAGVDWRPRRPRHSRTIARMMNDRPAALDLAVWLAREAGLALEDRTTAEARAAEMARLRTALQDSGRFGRWAAKWMDRIGDRRSDS